MTKKQFDEIMKDLKQVVQMKKDFHFNLTISMNYESNF